MDSRPAWLARAVHRTPDVSDPFWLILGVIAIACVVLFPLRLWMVARRRRSDDEDGGDAVPLAPPKREHRG